MSSLNKTRNNKVLSTAKVMATANVVAPNTFNKTSHNMRTFQGGQAHQISDLETLRRSVLSCLLWENNFYEDGMSVADRISSLIPKVDPVEVVKVAYQARTLSKLRHVPLLICCEMLKYPEHKKYVRRLIPLVVQRADELAELLSIYWKNEINVVRDKEGQFISQRASKKLPMQLIRGLRDTISNFDEYQLTKYLGNDKPVKMADVIRLIHPDPKEADRKIQEKNASRGYTKNVDMASVYKSIVAGTAKAPEDTWEVALSAVGKEGKKQVFEDLLDNRKLPAMALLRNLRGMIAAGVEDKKLKDGLTSINVERVLPYRFITARKYAPNLSNELQTAMFKCLNGFDKLPGKTVLLIDNSGSMGSPLSGKSEMTCVDGATGLAILAKELCEDSDVLLFDNSTFRLDGNNFQRVTNSNNSYSVWGRSSTSSLYSGTFKPSTLRGFDLSDAIARVPKGGTDLRQAVSYVNKNISYDRLIVFTDEQSATVPEAPKGKGYIVNVASYEHGVGYGNWCHINGFSESVIAYITEFEKNFQ